MHLVGHHRDPLTGQVTNADKSKTLGDALEGVRDAHVQMSLQLQQAFGLRREESIKFQPGYVDRGDHIALKGSWTKGGRERSVPITTVEQRRVFDQAHELAGAGSLIPVAARMASGSVPWVRHGGRLSIRCAASGERYATAAGADGAASRTAALVGPGKPGDCDAVMNCDRAAHWAARP